MQATSSKVKTPKTTARLVRSETDRKERRRGSIVRAHKNQSIDSSTDFFQFMYENNELLRTTLLETDVLTTYGFSKSIDTRVLRIRDTAGDRNMIEGISRYRALICRARMLYQSTFIVAEDAESSGNDCIQFSFPKLDTQVFSLGRCAVIHASNLLHRNEGRVDTIHEELYEADLYGNDDTDHFAEASRVVRVPVEYSEAVWKGALNSNSTAKELMQSSTGGGKDMDSLGSGSHGHKRLSSSLEISDKVDMLEQKLNVEKEATWLLQDLSLSQYLYQTGIAKRANEQAKFNWNDVIEASTKKLERNVQKLQALGTHEFVAHPHHDIISANLRGESVSLLQDFVSLIFTWRGWLSFVVRTMHERQRILVEMIDTCKEWLESHPSRTNDSRRPGYVTLLASMLLEYRQIGKTMAIIPCERRFHKHRASLSPLSQSPLGATRSVRLSTSPRGSPIFLDSVVSKLRSMVPTTTVNPLFSKSIKDVFSGETLVFAMVECSITKDYEDAFLLSSILMQKGLIIPVGNSSSEKFCFKSSMRSLYQFAPGEAYIVNKGRNTIVDSHRITSPVIGGRAALPAEA